jgi:hypothetical protein
MKAKKRVVMKYRSMLILAIIAGVMGILFLFAPDFELLSFMVTVAVLGGLIGGRNDYDESERQQLDHSYKTVFEWFLMVMLFAFTLIAFLPWIPALQGPITILNAQWPCLVLSILCILMGIAGFKKADNA